jgi:hypothetical protein
VPTLDLLDFRGLSKGRRFILRKLLVYWISLLIIISFRDANSQERICGFGVSDTGLSILDLQSGVRLGFIPNPADDAPIYGLEVSRDLSRGLLFSKGVGSEKGFYGMIDLIQSRLFATIFDPLWTTNIRDVRISPNATRGFGVSGDGLLVMDLNLGKSLAFVPRGAGQFFSSSPLDGFEISRDASRALLFSRGASQKNLGYYTVVDLTTLQVLNTITEDVFVSNIRNIKIASNDQRGFCLCENGLLIIDLETGSQLGFIELGEGSFKAYDFEVSAETDRALLRAKSSQSLSEKLLTIDLKDFKILNTFYNESGLKNVQLVRLSSDGKRGVCLASDGLTIIDLKTGNFEGSISSFNPVPSQVPFMGLDISPLGEKVLLYGQDSLQGFYGIANLAQKNLSTLLWEPLGSKCIKAVRITSDGKKGIGLSEKGITIIDLETGQVLNYLSKPSEAPTDSELEGLELSSDDTRALVYGLSSSDSPGFYAIYDLVHGVLLNTILDQGLSVPRRSNEVENLSSKESSSSHENPKTTRHPLSIISEAPLVCVAGQKYQYQLEINKSHFRDRATDKIQFNLSVSPSGILVNPKTGLIEWVPSLNQVGKMYEITASASDLDGARAEQTFFLFVQESLAIRSVTPSVVVNMGTKALVIEGSDFRPGALVKLVSEGKVVTASAAVVSSSSTIQCFFDLNSASSGSWDILVQNIDGSSVTLPNGLALESSTLQHLK